MDALRIPSLQSSPHVPEKMIKREEREKKQITNS
jgi:hypothetical protein